MKQLFIFFISVIAFMGCEEIVFPEEVIAGKQTSPVDILDTKEVSTATAILVCNTTKYTKFYYKSPEGTIFSAEGKEDNKTFYAKLPLLKGNAEYTFYAEVNGKKTQEKTFKTKPHTPAEAVDLGLSVKWASWNFGATSPTETGGYYRFGATTEVDYNESDLSPIESVSGTERDIVKQMWGDHWKTPSASDFDELLSNCAKTEISIDGVKCYQFIGPNGNSIVLPRGGYRIGITYYEQNRYGYDCFYWTGTRGWKKYYYWSGGSNRHYSESDSDGYLIRPVYVD